ncbi:uncharacterized protein LOC128280435 [Gossypium arboreum]|uniref:uncharacterized protein LOC128280435 n=1 Tax=Gossypium arboreum TaxID=29729 RepID=UPI0022F1BB68|nr:uncharacterized protein LOC128280435 [Gossypium arboreum]
MVRLEGNGLSHGQRALSRGAGHTKVRYPALVFAAHRREDEDASNVIIGMIFIYYVPYIALIDIRSIQSYIACTVSKTLGILVESTMSEVTVLSLLGQSVKVNKLFREVLLEIQGVIFLVDLMELPFQEFDLILEMDWLVKHRVSLDCATKRMVLRTVEDGKVIVIRERQNYLLNVISAMRAERRYHSDHIISVEEIEVRPDLTFEEEPAQILDRDVKVLRRKSIPLVKVLWCNHSSAEATWEPEDVMRQ